MKTKSELRSNAVAAGGALLIATIWLAGLAALLQHGSTQADPLAVAQTQHLDTIVVSASRLPQVERMETMVVTASRHVPTESVAATHVMPVEG